MSSIIYKRLFEVHILHDFFLAKEETADSFFGLTNSEQTTRLTALLASGQYNSTQLFSIQPLGPTEQLLRDHRMRLIHSPLGFFIGVEVKGIAGLGSELFYEPFIPLPDDLELLFGLKGGQSNLLNTTNLSLRKSSLPTKYIFSNESGQLLNNRLVLSRPIPINLPAGAMMGDLVKTGNQVEALYYDIVSNNASFEAIDGDGFVNRADRVLLPKQFTYNFQSALTGNVTFRLLDGANVEVKVIEKVVSSDVRAVRLDFSSKIVQLPDLDINGNPILVPISIANGAYTLEVTNGVNPVETSSIELYDEADAERQFGIIKMKIKTGNASFDLIDANGQLLTRQDVNGNKIFHPVFELRFLNRRTFWRYIHPSGFANNTISTDLVLKGDQLITKEPRRLTNTLQIFKSDQGANMPNPQTALIELDDKQLMSTIYLSNTVQLK